MIFRVQWSQKSPKSGKMCLTKMYLGPCKGAAPDMLLLPAAPLQAPCGSVAPLQGPDSFLSNTFFHYLAIFNHH